MRLFLALELPPEVKSQLFVASSNLLPVRWGLTDPTYKKVFRLSQTRQENLHVTLKFLGEVAEQQAPKVCDALRRVEPAGELGLRTEGLEFFPNRGPIHVVAAKVGGDVDRLVDLHSRLEKACSALGFAPERRPYRPHVTLLRANNGMPSHLRQSFYHTSTRKSCTLHEVPPFPVADFLMNEFVLVESRLGRKHGPEYAAVARFALRNTV
jgi:RNA 2',3'-cyclic 3'-phosphodiesterase